MQRARQAQGLKQQDIASLLYKSLSTVKKWESSTGAEPSNLDDLIRLCEVYGITVEYYLSGKENRFRPLSKRQEHLLRDFDKLTPTMQRRMSRIIRVLASKPE